MPRHYRQVAAKFLVLSVRNGAAIGPAPRLAAAASAVLVVAALVLPVATADEASDGDRQIASRISAADPLNGGYLLVNMHGMLFHPEVTDIQEDLSYARWLGGSVVRAFATDSSGLRTWDGTQVGRRIAEIAPLLRAARLRMIVAFVNNHQAVPGESSFSVGWMDNYLQLLLPFYTQTWRGAYLRFVRDLVSTVQWYQATDVVFAWELGNELHTPRDPPAVIPFINDAVTAVRGLDPVTPILPGTMGANHVQPGVPDSPIARWLYCEAPIDGYTLHAYDWVSRQRPGDMPIDWDLDTIVSKPCSNGRALPVIVEELGTSRGLAGMYIASDEAARLDQERRQIAFIRQFPQVVAFGVWNGESPRLVDRTFVDTRRGLTSYGPDGTGGGSCYDPAPEPAPGARCQLEQLLRGLRFVRTAGSNEWTPIDRVNAPDPLIGAVDAVVADDDRSGLLMLSGWVLDPGADDAAGVSGLDVLLGEDRISAAQLIKQTGLARADIPASLADDVARANAGFSIGVPLAAIAPGTSLLTLRAHTPEHGTWERSVQVVVPSVGPVPVAPARPIRQALPTPFVQAQPLKAEIQSPQPNDLVQRSFSMQVLAGNADRVDVFMEPDRDRGGRLVGSASAADRRTAGGSQSVQVAVTVPSDTRTLFVHVASMTSGQEVVLELPVRVQ